MKAFPSFETSVSTYQSTRRYISRNLHQHRWENLKCLKNQTYSVPKNKLFGNLDKLYKNLQFILYMNSKQKKSSTVRMS